MKTSLRILVAATSLAIAAPVYAQGGGGGGGGQQMTPEQRLARTKDQLFKEITLTPVQSAQADTLLMTFSTKQMEMMTAARAGGGDMAAMGEQRAKLTAERNAALKALLTTDEQKTKFDANVAAMPVGRGRGGF